MHKLFVVVLALLAGLSVAGQAIAAASAGYSDCCLQDCQGTLHCAAATCAACAAPQAVPLHEPPVQARAGALHGTADSTSFDPGPVRAPLTPPD